MNRIITSTRDIIPDPELLYVFKDFPVFMGTTDRDIQFDEFRNMNIYIEKNSGIIQISPVLPHDLVYLDSHNSGSVGKIWAQHHCEFSKFVLKNSGNSVFEIGAGHGKLYNLCKDKINKWKIIDLNISTDNDVEYVKGIFDADTDIDGFDTIVHSHVIEHMYDIDEFLKIVSSKLKIGEKMIFSMPNMIEMLKRKYLNCINFEHTILISENLIEYFLSKNNFKITDKSYFLESHSIFYCVEKCDKVKEIEYKNSYNEHKKLFLDYIDFYSSLVKYINKEINNKENVYLFGAHIFSQYLINFGINVDNIKCIIDNDIKKKDKRLYGTNLFSTTPDILKNDTSPIVILKAGALSPEIKEEILNINKNTIFIEETEF